MCWSRSGVAASRTGPMAPVRFLPPGVCRGPPLATYASGHGSVSLTESRGSPPRASRRGPDASASQHPGVGAVSGGAARRSPRGEVTGWVSATVSLRPSPPVPIVVEQLPKITLHLGTGDLCLKRLPHPVEPAGCWRSTAAIREASTEAAVTSSSGGSPSNVPFALVGQFSIMAPTASRATCRARAPLTGCLLVHTVSLS
jgi:hypothetical protein